MSEKALVVLSGGQDSTTCLYMAKKHHPEVHAVTFDYGQRHRREILAAKRVAALADVASHEIIVMGDILKGTSPLVSDNELEQYSDFNALPGGIEKTFVPMRNPLFLTIAVNRAVVLGANAVYTGVCQEDFGGYPDCRDIFISAFETMAMRALDQSIRIFAPLMYLTKKRTVLEALKIDGCYEALAYTHTGYDGLYPPTGKDHATLLREKGFFEAGVPDPLVVRAFFEGLMPLPKTPNYQDENGRPHELINYLRKYL